MSMRPVRRRLWFLPVLTVLSFVAPRFAQETPAEKTEKSPVKYSSEEKDKAVALIKDVFKIEFVRAAENENTRLKLAKTLLEQSQRIKKEDAVYRFMALTFARDLAAEASDHQTAFAAIAELDKDHQIDVPAMKEKVLATVVQSVTDPDKAKSLSALMFDMANAMSDQDNYDRAVGYAQLAATAAKKAGHPPLVSLVESRLKRLIAVQKELKRIEPFLKKLEANPNDPAANLEVGKSYCFVRDRWEKGLPFLGKSADTDLHDVAKKDLQSPQQGTEQAALADQWAKVAGKYEGTTKLQMLRRAFQWYQRAVFQLQGDAKTKVTAELKKLTETLPAKYRVTVIESEIRRINAHTAEVINVAFSPSALMAVSCGADKSIRLWNLTTGNQDQVFNGHFGPVFAAVFSKDEKHVFSTSEDNTIRMWDVKNAKQVNQFKGNNGVINGLAVSPDGKLLAGGDRSVHLWNIETGKIVKELKGHNGSIFGVAFSPDGKLLASASDDQTVRLWDVNKGVEVNKLVGHTGQAIGVSFSPSGDRLLSCGEDNTIRLWDVKTGKEIRRYTGHTSIVGDVVFSPDGSQLVSSSDDRTIRIWDVETGEMIRQLTGHTDAVYALDYSPDGRWVISGSLDKTVRVWGERR